MRSPSLCTSLLVFALGSSLLAQTPAPDAEPFVHTDGTTHWYRAVHTPKGITWEAAQLAAHQAGGRLVTIHDAKENAFVAKLIKDPKFWDLSKGDGPWMGGLQAINATEPSGGWGWTEFESFSYTNWASKEPDNLLKADRMCFGTQDINKVVDTWKDQPANHKARGYVIEFAWGSVPRTLGLLKDSPLKQPGYTVFAPLRANDIYLIDGRGRPVHKWSSVYPPGAANYVLPNGDMIRAGNVLNTNFNYGGNGGVLERFDWAGKVIWTFFHSSPTEVLHHDFAVMPNGNILALVWIERTKAEAIAAGRDPNDIGEGRVCPDKIIEIKPNATGGGTIVWEWDPWDHLIQDFDNTKANYGNVGVNPEFIDINYNVRNDGDWMHTNAIDYNAKLDQIVISVRHFDEFWVIDHSTTTAEARTGKGGRSGKGGRLLYRWGNPAAYRRGTAQDRRLFRQHNVHWIKPGLRGAGNILLFNNGVGRGHSSVDEIKMPTPDHKGNYPMQNGVWGPSKAHWSWTATKPTDIFAGFVSGAERQPNGNTLICAGGVGRTLEVDQTGKVLWELTTPLNRGQLLTQGDEPTGNELFRAERLPLDHPAIKGKVLKPMDTFEVAPMGLLIEGAGTDHYCKPGDLVELEVSAQADKSGKRREFQLLTSMTPGLTVVSNRAARIGVDPLFEYSINPSASATFQGYHGKLGLDGRAKAHIQVPAIPALSGLSLYSTFLILDPAAIYDFAWVGSTNVLHIR